MYKLINEYGNRIIRTENETEKNRLLKEGFHIDTTYNTQPKKESAPTQKAMRSRRSLKGESIDEQTGD